MQMLGAGRLTTFYKPYISLGDVETDSVKLFLSAYKDYVEEVGIYHYKVIL